MNRERRVNADATLVGLGLELEDKDLFRRSVLHSIMVVGT